MIEGTGGPLPHDVGRLARRLLALDQGAGMSEETVVELHGTRPFGSSLAYFPFTDQKVYIAITAFLLNVIIAVVLTVVLRALKVSPGTDGTAPDDYYSEAGDPHVIDQLDLDVEARAAGRAPRTAT